MRWLKFLVLGECLCRSFFLLLSAKSQTFVAVMYNWLASVRETSSVKPFASQAGTSAPARSRVPMELIVTTTNSYILGVPFLLDSISNLI